MILCFILLLIVSSSTGQFDELNERVKRLSDNALFASLSGDIESEVRLLSELTGLLSHTSQDTSSSYWRRYAKALVKKQTVQASDAWNDSNRFHWVQATDNAYKTTKKTIHSALFESDIETVTALPGDEWQFDSTVHRFLASRQLTVTRTDSFRLAFGQQVEPMRFVCDDAVAIVVRRRGIDVDAHWRIHLTDPRAAASVVARGQTPLFEAGTKFIDVSSQMILFPGAVPFYTDVHRQRDAPPIDIDILHLRKRKRIDDDIVVVPMDNDDNDNVAACVDNVVVERRWPTPLIVIDMDVSLDDDAVAYVRADASQDIEGRLPRRQKSNQGGHQSGTSLLDGGALPDSLVRARHFIEQSVGHMISSSSSISIVASWSCLNGPLDWNSPHVHPDSDVSGVLYLHVPTPAARLCLIDPRPMLSRSRHCIEPASNRLVLFPSFVEHHVEPNLSESNEMRVAIAFNIRVKQV